MRKIAALVFLIGPILVLASACGDDDSVSNATQGLCSSLDSLDQTVEQVAGSGIDPKTTTVGDVQDALDQIESGVQDVQSAEGGLGNAVKSSLQSAFDDFKSALQDIPSDDTLSQAGQAVTTAQSDFAQAWNDMVSELQCPAPTSTS